MENEIRIEIPDTHLFLDIDGVLATNKQFISNRKNWHPEYNSYKFDENCVKILNEILATHPMIIILSSDWRLKYKLDMLNRIFEINNVNTKVFDITPNLWGIKYFNAKYLEDCRAEEILKYVEDNQIKNYLAIDDLNLSKWLLPNNFIYTPNSNEGIKQCGIKDKILKLINQI